MSEQDGLVEHFVMVQDAMVAYKRRAKAAEAEVERLKGVLGDLQEDNMWLQVVQGNLRAIMRAHQKDCPNCRGKGSIEVPYDSADLNDTSTVTEDCKQCCPSSGSTRRRIMSATNEILQEMAEAIAGKYHTPSEGTYDEARRILSALRSAGWAVVPVEPTLAMNESGYLAKSAGGWSSDIYKAMLKAAQEDSRE